MAIVALKDFKTTTQKFKAGDPVDPEVVEAMTDEFKAKFIGTDAVPFSIVAAIESSVTQAPAL